MPPRCNLNDFMDIYYDSALEKADFPTITPAIVRQARKSYPESKIYNLPAVITKSDDRDLAALAGKEGRALGDKGFQQGDIRWREVEG